MGPSAASCRHHGTGQLLGVHARQRGSVDRRERGGVWRRQQSCPGDLRRSRFRVVKDLLQRVDGVWLLHLRPKRRTRVQDFYILILSLYFDVDVQFRAWRRRRRLKLLALALATNCRHSMLSLQRTSFHLTPSFETSLYGCILIPTMLQRVCSECELQQAFLMCCGTLFPKCVVGLSTVSGEGNRKYREMRC